MTILYCVCGGLLLFIGFLFWAKNRQVNNFRKNIQPGDQCYIYSNETRIIVLVEKIRGDRIYVTQREGLKRVVTREELYI